MESYLWKISDKKLNETNLKSYSNFINQNYKVNSGNDFNKIWKWSINNTKEFWKSIWEFTKVKAKIGNILFEESNEFINND